MYEQESELEKCQEPTRIDDKKQEIKLSASAPVFIPQEYHPGICINARTDSYEIVVSKCEEIAHGQEVIKINDVNKQDIFDACEIGLCISVIDTQGKGLNSTLLKQILNELTLPVQLTFNVIGIANFKAGLVDIIKNDNTSLEILYLKGEQDAAFGGAQLEEIFQALALNNNIKKVIFENICIHASTSRLLEKVATLRAEIILVFTNCMHISQTIQDKIKIFQGTNYLKQNKSCALDKEYAAKLEAIMFDGSPTSQYKEPKASGHYLSFHNKKRHVPIKIKIN